MQTLLVFSHLRWNFVYQRPQHILSRLAARWPIVYVEEPIPGASHDHIEVVPAAPGLEVWRPHLRDEGHGLHSGNREAMQRLVKQALRSRNIVSYWIWFYTPMAVPVAEALQPEGIVYDCMDELSMFKGAPPQLLDNERALFSCADIVFTGGRSLYAAKRDLHRNVHCFPSSVDAQHFRVHRQDHALQASLPRPRLGYCGVIDERIDLDLIAGIASARPDWQIVMVGPTAKIDPASLPAQANIHWLGQQGYDDLPAFIQSWDVCLLPFALNDSTRFISPTKTLEYMACGKPSVSTAIRDVVEPYGGVVPIRWDASGFVEACEAFMQRSPAQCQIDGLALKNIISRTSWDATASSMGDLLAKAQGVHAPAAMATERWVSRGAGAGAISV